MTHKTAPTPGTWQYKPEFDHRGTAIWAEPVDEDGKKKPVRKIADVRGSGHLQMLGSTESEQDANGYLLAAAPTLLEACKVAAKALYSGDEDARVEAFKHVCEAIEAAERNTTVD